jgi:hypothetical protein
MRDLYDMRKLILKIITITLRARSILSFVIKGEKP